MFLLLKGIQSMNKWLIALLRNDSLLLSLVYTVGHIFIAAVCAVLITGASLQLATIDALVEPIINGFWFYFLHVDWKKISSKHDYT